MSALYIAGAIVLPVAVVIALLGFDRLLQFAQQRRRLIWPLIVVTQIFGLAANAMEGKFGIGFALHVVLSAIALFSWNYESRHLKTIEAEQIGRGDTPSA